MTDIKATIMQKIRAGEMRMRPRWQFVLQSALLVLGSVTVGLAVLYLASLFVFASRLNGAFYAPSFGVMGLLPFLRAMPWVLIALALLFIAALELLVRHFAFAYRQPLLYSALGVIAFSIVGTSLVLETALHDRLEARAERGDAPFIGAVYRHFGEKSRDLSVGTLTVFINDGFMLDERRRGMLRIIVGPATKLPADLPLQEGDTVIVLGPEDHGAVRALGVRRLVLSQSGPPEGRASGWDRQSLPLH
jgi:hypothetical protein